MAFKNPSIITNGISKEEFEKLKDQVEKNTIDIAQIKNNKNSTYIEKEAEYIIKNEIPDSAFLTSIPRVLEIDITPRKKETIEENDILDTDMIPISSLYDEKEENYILLDSVPNLAQVNGGQRTMIIEKSPVQILSKVQA